MYPKNLNSELRRSLQYNRMTDILNDTADTQRGYPAAISLRLIPEDS